MTEPLFTLTWEYAPDWAQWFAFDQDGYACWYSRKPEIDEYVDATAWTSEGQVDLALIIQKEIAGWKDSLKQRPGVLRDFEIMKALSG